MKKIILVGGFHEVIELCEDCGYRVVGVIDDKPIKWTQPIPILGTDQDAKSILKKHSDCELVITPDNPQVRSRLVEYYRPLGFSFATIIHPSAFISPSAHIGEGTVIQKGVNVSSGTYIGSFCKLNTLCNVMHDNCIEDYSTIAPNAVLLGGVSIGRGSYVGANSTILPKCILGESAIVGAGAVVTKNVADKQTVVGVPAKPLNK